MRIVFEDSETITSRHKSGTKERLDKMAQRLSQQTGKRVTVSSLIREAVEEKYPEKQKRDLLSLI